MTINIDRAALSFFNATLASANTYQLLPADTKNTKDFIMDYDQTTKNQLTAYNKTITDNIHV